LDKLVRILLTGFFIVLTIVNVEANELRDFNLSIPLKPVENDSTLLLQLEDSWAKALVKRDSITFQKILAEGMVYTENDQIYSRDTVLFYVTYGPDTVEAAYNQDMEVHLFGITAVVTGWLNIKGRNSGNKFNRRYRFTDTWMKITNTWQIIAAQDYLVP